ncbi:MAG TPA: sugar phosphate isomerase/epimerase [Tepidisphaeraceae bacterium]
MSLDDYVALARRLDVGGIEIHAEHLFNVPDAKLKELRDTFDALGWWVVLARPLMMDCWDRTIAVAEALAARTIRMHCTSVLCGDRVANCDWPALVAEVRRRLLAASELTRDHGLWLGIEDHQDFCSCELMELCEMSGENVGIALDTANPLSVAEDPLDFARAVAPRVRHVHLKDYRAHWSDPGYRLVRCAVGEGCVPFAAIAGLFADRPEVTAAIEVGSLNARHIRLFEPGYWTHRPAHPVEQFSKALAAARVKRFGEDEDWRTPWERGESPDRIVAYELAQVERSAANLRSLGLM